MGQLALWEQIVTVRTERFGQLFNSMLQLYKHRTFAIATLQTPQLKIRLLQTSCLYCASSVLMPREYSTLGMPWKLMELSSLVSLEHCDDHLYTTNTQSTNQVDTSSIYLWASPLHLQFLKEGNDVIVQHILVKCCLAIRTGTLRIQSALCELMRIDNAEFVVSPTALPSSSSLSTTYLMKEPNDVTVCIKSRSRSAMSSEFFETPT